jgi:hypothetical protein
MRRPGVFMLEFGAIKNAAWAGRVSFFTLYIYFIKLGGVNRKGFGKYFPNRENGLGGIGCVWGLDRILGPFALTRKSRFLPCASLGSE